MNKKTHRGSDFRDFLKQEGILEEVEARALKRALALELRRLLKEKSLTKSEMAERMSTSRAAVDRLLVSAEDAAAMGRRAEEVVRAGQGATDRHVTMILQQLPVQGVGTPGSVGEQPRRVAETTASELDA